MIDVIVTFIFYRENQRTRSFGTNEPNGELSGGDLSGIFQQLLTMLRNIPPASQGQGRGVFPGQDNHMYPGYDNHMYPGHTGGYNGYDNHRYPGHTGGYNGYDNHMYPGHTGGYPGYDMYPGYGGQTGGYPGYGHGYGVYPSQGPMGVYPSQGPGMYPGYDNHMYPSQGPNGVYPSQAPGMYPGHDNGVYPSQAPGMYPGHDNGVYPSQGPGMYPWLQSLCAPNSRSQWCATHPRSWWLPWSILCSPRFVSISSPIKFQDNNFFYFKQLRRL